MQLITVMRNSGMKHAWCYYIGILSVYWYLLFINCGPLYLSNEWLQWLWMHKCNQHTRSSFLFVMKTVPYCCRSWGSKSSPPIQRWEQSTKATWSGCICSSHCPVNFNKSHKVSLNETKVDINAWGTVLFRMLYPHIDSYEPDLVGMQTRESFLAWQDNHSEEPWKRSSPFQPQTSGNAVLVEIPKSTSSIGK